MKRQILTFVAALAIMAAPALFAQSTLNTTAPGPSQETKPGQTNNNLQNPGSHMEQGAQNQTGTSTAVTSSAPTPPDTTPAPAPMNDDTTGTMSHTDTMGTSGTTGSATTTTTTTTTPPDTTGSYNGTASTSSSTSSRRLPKTASDLPTVALAGLLALFAAFAVRFYSKRNVA